jgi:type IX secretion system PorP/SprF family membrane protein
MMRKIAITSILLLSCLLKVSSQMDPLYTQFMTNPFLINPALAGTYSYYQIIANSRLQWAGFTDAPVTNVISMFGPTVTQPMGLGGYIMHDVTGLTSMTTLSGTYAYNYGIAEDLKISMGLALGIFQYKIDGSGNVYEGYDPIYGGQDYVQYGPDASLGLYLFSSIYHVGLSMTNLLGNKININGDSIATGLSRFTRDIYLHAGYKYMINRELSIEPTVIFRKSKATPVQMDFDVRAWYGKRQWENTKIWGGFSFRTQDAFIILLGCTYQRKIEVGFSYDIGVNKMRKFNNGSYELMLGFKFNDIKEY